MTTHPVEYLGKHRYRVRVHDARGRLVAKLYGTSRQRVERVAEIFAEALRMDAVRLRGGIGKHLERGLR